MSMQIEIDNYDNLEFEILFENDFGLIKIVKRTGTCNADYYVVINGKDKRIDRNDLYKFGLRVIKEHDYERD